MYLRKCIASVMALLLAVAGLGGCDSLQFGTPAFLTGAPSVTPSSGPTSGGTAVTIFGSSFSQDTAVLFGESSATDVVVVNPNVLTAVTPPHAAGSVDLTLFEPDAAVILDRDADVVTIRGGFTYTDPPAPAPVFMSVARMTPSSGPVDGGTVVTIQGTSFTDGAAILFGSGAATNVEVLSSQLMTAVAPPQEAGLVDVVVIRPDGESATVAAGFEYVAPQPPAPLSVDAITPASGLSTGGTEVVITGSSFREDTAVIFGGTAAGHVTFVNNQLLSAVTPPHAMGTVDVTLVGNDQRATLDGAFEYLDPPEPPELSLDAITPASGLSTGDTEVVITGSSFTEDTAVIFGGTVAGLVTFVNNQLLTAVTPPHATGAVDVTLVGNDQRATLDGAFEYLDPPDPPVLSLESITPDAGPMSGETLVTILGTGFDPDTALLFGGSAATEVSVINDQVITAKTPAGSAGLVTITTLAQDGRVDSLSDGFTYEAPTPAALDITLILCNVGPAAGDKVVTIEGNGFVEGTEVFFGVQPATEVQVLDGQRLTAVTPPNAEGTADVRLTTPNELEFTRIDAYTYETLDLPGRDTDCDLDGLSDSEERAGHVIEIDDTGFGWDGAGDLLTRRAVTSDPTAIDTDDDGLDDFDEFIIRSNPRAADTDGDGLDDNEEWHRWLTSPVSIDTDADARGPDHDLPPNGLLFDGLELYSLNTLADPSQPRSLRSGASSPTLADTDGDGVSDFEELASPIRSPLIADIPQAEIIFEGEIDILLRVDYAEGTGTASEYGSSFSTTDSTKNSKSTTDSASTTTAASGSFLDDLGDAGGVKQLLLSKGAEMGVSAACGFIEDNQIGIGPISLDSVTPDGVSEEVAGHTAGATDLLNIASDEIGLCEEAKPETTTTHSTTFSQESAHSATEEYSKYLTESRTRTETTTSGSVSTGLRIRNNSITPYRLEQLFITMMQWQVSPDPNFALGTGVFRTLATLRPSGEDFNVVLGPGESTQIIQVAAEDVNPAIIKQFLARPSAIFYEPAGFELSNDEGINFDFLTSQTYAQSATLNIDYDNGTQERYLVATNVDRNENGELAGVTLGTILNEIVGITAANTPGPGVYTTDLVNGVQVLSSIRGTENIRDVEDQTPNVGDVQNGVLRDPMRIWVAYVQDTNHADEDGDFEDIVVKHGDVIRLIYTADLDGDGLLAAEEDIYGSSDQNEDTDGDGLTDFQEVKVGWTVSITDIRAATAAPIQYQAYANPLSSDADGDGWDDLKEKTEGTDPGNADTDDDAIIDSSDSHPLIPAQKLYVDASGVGGDGTGTSWANAFSDLKAALDEAALRNLPGDDLDDISQIWVAGGVYEAPPGEAFELPYRVAVFGGFSGGETRRSQRIADPFLGGVLLVGNGATTVRVSANAGPGTSLDGFAVTGPVSNGMVISGSASFRNLLVESSSGRGIRITGNSTRADFTKCRITQTDRFYAAMSFSRRRSTGFS